MPVNLQKMNQERARRKGAGEIIALPEGDTAAYICSGSRPDDDVPYKEVKVHYGLGPKGRSMVICTEKSTLMITLPDPQFRYLQEQLEALGKKLEPCAVCEALEAGSDKVSEDQNGTQSRWWWIVAPLKHRASGDSPYKAWDNTDQIGAFIVGYRVWDSILDKFQQVKKDITSPDAATLIRVLRTGKGLKTRWSVEVDLETFGSPLRLPDSLRTKIAEETAPGKMFDYYRIIASMVRSREEVVSLLAGTALPEDEFEEEEEEASTEKTSEPTTKEGGKFSPPTKGKRGKSAEAKATEAPKSNGSNGQTGATTSSAPAAPQAAKPQGDPPPCFKMDCEPADLECQKCPWKVPCATALGLAVPPDPPGATPAAAQTKPAVEAIPVEKCQAGASYQVEGIVATYKGLAKGKHFFNAPDGKPIKLEPGTTVVPASSSSPLSTAATETDENLDSLEAALQKKRAAKST